LKEAHDNKGRFVDQTSQPDTEGIQTHLANAPDKIRPTLSHEPHLEGQKEKETFQMLSDQEVFKVDQLSIPSAKELVNNLRHSRRLEEGP
jgi:hypothetical protein